MPGGSALPPGIAGFEPYLGAHGMSHVLSIEGIGSDTEPLAGLPVPPRACGRDYVFRVTTAVLDLVDDYPVGHLLVPPDVVLLRAAGAAGLPVTVWLPPGTAAEVAEHFHRSVATSFDVTTAPDLPRPRGTLPALVVLGALSGGLCHLPPACRALLDLYTTGQILGISALIDPTDRPDGGRARWLGWPSVWTARFTVCHRPADDEVDPVAATPSEEP